MAEEFEAKPKSWSIPPATSAIDSDWPEADDDPEPAARPALELSAEVPVRPPSAPKAARPVVTELSIPAVARRSETAELAKPLAPARAPRVGWTIALAAALGIVAAAALWLRSPASNAAVANAAPAREAPPPPAAVQPPPAAPQTSPPPVAEPAPAPAPEAPAALADTLAPPAAPPEMVEVTVRVAPEGAAIFEHGRRLASNVATVSVPRGTKKTLILLLDGYIPRKLVVDGSKNSVSITLRQSPAAASPAPAAEPAAAEGAPAPPPAESQPPAPAATP